MNDDDLKILSQSEINNELKTLPGWTFEKDKISKEFKFTTFMDGLKLINELAPFCNQIDHHPDIHIYYKKIKFELQRFSFGGKVTSKDFIVARKIEQLFEERVD